MSNKKPQWLIDAEKAIQEFNESKYAKMTEGQLNNSTAHMGLVFSKEARQKMSAANRGEKHNMYGKKHSAETRQKISAAKKGENSHNYGKPALNRKLTFTQAEEIRHRYKTEKISTRKLAAEYDVSCGTICNIINNKLYTTE